MHFFFFTVGSLFALGILSRLLKINDAMIGLIATLFDIVTAIGFLIVTQVQYLLYGEYNMFNIFENKLVCCLTY